MKTLLIIISVTQTLSLFAATQNQNSINLNQSLTEALQTVRALDLQNNNHEAGDTNNLTQLNSVNNQDRTTLTAVQELNQEKGKL